MWPIRLTIKEATLENQKITVQAVPTDLGEGLLVVIDLINESWAENHYPRI